MNNIDRIYLALLFSKYQELKDDILSGDSAILTGLVKVTNEDLNEPYNDTHIFLEYNSYQVGKPFYEIELKLERLREYVGRKVVTINKRQTIVLTFLCPFNMLTEYHKIKSGDYSKIQTSTVIDILNFWDKPKQSELYAILTANLTVLGHLGIRLYPNSKGELINALNDPIELSEPYILSLRKRVETTKPEGLITNGLFYF